MEHEIMNNTASLVIPPERSFIPPLTDFVLRYARHFKMGSDDSNLLKDAFLAAMDLVMGSNSGVHSRKKILIEIFESKGKLVIKILNHGIPILANTGAYADAMHSLNISRFRETTKRLDEITVENFGRDGQTVTLKTRLGKEAVREAVMGSSSLIPAAKYSERDVTIRRLESWETPALSRLFYSVYGYNYINEMVYYPEKLAEMMSNNRLISTAAVLPDGRLVGHVGLVRHNDKPPVFEAALGLVDPTFKSKGLFKDIFGKVMETVRSTPMQYCFFDFVTNHERSQKMISAYGTCDMAIFVGCQSGATQATLEHLGIGSDLKDMDRYTILFSIIPQVKHPFGKEVYLPPSMAEPLEFLLEPLGLTWIPTPRFHFLPDEGQYKTSCQPMQNSVIFDMNKPGRKAVEDMLIEWNQFLRDGYQYGAVEVPVSAPGLADLYNMLSENGFFIAGFIPYHMSDTLGFRFQATGYTKVALGKIKTATNASKRLLKLIKAKRTYAKNSK
ncbi:hypothetical protein ACFL6Y_05080 [Elusimicrobiota bacterium]